MNFDDLVVLGTFDWKTSFLIPINEPIIKFEELFEKCERKVSKQNKSKQNMMKDFLGALVQHQ